MFNAGTIFYVTPFYFKNGNTARNKYFIVLYSDGDNLIVASLPTRTDIIPKSLVREHGCINDINFNCYMFEKDQIITKDIDWAFDMDTFIYGVQVEDYQITRLKFFFEKENKDYIVIGILTDFEYKSIIDCFSNSTAVKYKHRRYLQSISV